MPLVESFSLYLVSLLIPPKRQLSIWGDEQEDDVSDVSDKLSVLLHEVGDLEDQYVDRYDQYRKALKKSETSRKLCSPFEIVS